METPPSPRDSAKHLLLYFFKKTCCLSGTKQTVYGDYFNEFTLLKLKKIGTLKSNINYTGIFLSRNLVNVSLLYLRHVSLTREGVMVICYGN